MESKLTKTILFASFLWLAGVFLPQKVLGADTIAYAIQIGSQTLGTLDLNTGVFTQISTQAIAESQIAAYGGVLYGAGACDCLIQINTSPSSLSRRPRLSPIKITMASALITASGLLPMVCL